MWFSFKELVYENKSFLTCLLCVSCFVHPFCWFPYLYPPLRIFLLYSPPHISLYSHFSILFIPFFLKPFSAVSLYLLPSTCPLLLCALIIQVLLLYPLNSAHMSVFFLHSFFLHLRVVCVQFTVNLTEASIYPFIAVVTAVNGWSSIEFSSMSQFCTFI